MLIKRFIFFVLILFIFFSTGQTAPKNEMLHDRVALKKLINDIDKFETAFYSSDSTVSFDFANGVRDINNLVKVFTMLDSQYPDSNFDQVAFTYLEKKKKYRDL